jgi:hypothetical protein
MQVAEELITIFGQALVSRMSGLLENRKPILYSERDARLGGQFGRRLKNSAANVVVRIPKIYRGAFLWGCANAVNDLDHEVMLLGFGRAESNRNSITASMKIIGQQHKVSPTIEAQIGIEEHLAADSQNSIMLVHNHPDHVLSSALALFLGLEPLPSLKDRNTALSALLRRLKCSVAGNQHGEIRFFLVERDEVAEFSGLNAGSLADVLRLFGPAMMDSTAKMG